MRDPWRNSIDHGDLLVIALCGAEQTVEDTDLYRGWLAMSQLDQACDELSIPLVCPHPGKVAGVTCWPKDAQELVDQMVEPEMERVKATYCAVLGLSAGANAALRIAHRNDLVDFAVIHSSSATKFGDARLDLRMLFVDGEEWLIPTARRTRKLYRYHLDLGVKCSLLSQEGKSPKGLMGGLLKRHWWNPAINGQVFDWLAEQMAPASKWDAPSNK